MDGAKLVSSAVLGIDCETVIVGGEVYVIYPPTIERLAGAGYHLSDLKGNTIAEMLSNLTDLFSACKALSWFIEGNESKAGKLSKGTLKEVCDGLEKAISMIGIENFVRLSASARNVRSLIATTR